MGKVGYYVNTKKIYFVVDKKLNVVDKFRLSLTAWQQMRSKKWRDEKGVFLEELRVLRKDVYERAKQKKEEKEAK